MLLLDGGGFTALSKIENGALMWQPFASLLRQTSVEKVHRDFAKAGSTVIETFTYPVTPYHVKRVIELARSPEPLLTLEANSLLDEIRNLTQNEPDVFFWTKRCAQAAIQAAINVQKSSTKNILIAISIPPLGPSYSTAPTDSKDYQPLREAIEEIMFDNPARFVLLAETLSGRRAFDTACAGVLMHFRVPKWAAFCVEAKDDIVCLDDEPLSSVARAAQKTCDVILINCSGITVTLQAIKVLKNMQIPFGAYPNITPTSDHQPFGWTDILECWKEDAEDAEESEESDEEEMEFHEAIITIAKDGAEVVGGCCGTLPRDLFDAYLELD